MEQARGEAPGVPRPAGQVRLAVGAALVGYALAAFLVATGLDVAWTGLAPTRPVPGLGLIHARNVHGVHRYLSGFQSTALALLLWSALPAGLLGFLALPVQLEHRFSPAIEGGRVRPRWRWIAKPGGPLAGWAVAVAALIALAGLLLAGPTLVRAMNASGLVMDAG